ncbi:hypothetical protein Bresa_00786|uniref:Uncharacterized protein n=1 Tax=Brenneria salicis ATCC 15712 = DSM 30166 TaxID=714314 RepID=A0A366IA27_9GAMM|nr:hypothetical protein [Brenneria salicis ATCC 15712 = DSM 30166]RBP66803.1 hypothetical protein DES54_10211 [Brenneria salicis ATCC 15712 = DSM 30166]RLM32209.1 hypothetical protein BHG07_02215 [Brenneria salicis ATCC 15712 = DSM 30166]
MLLAGIWRLARQRSRFFMADLLPVIHAVAVLWVSFSLFTIKFLRQIVYNKLFTTRGKGI